MRRVRIPADRVSLAAFSELFNCPFLRISLSLLGAATSGLSIASHPIHARPGYLGSDGMKFCCEAAEADADKPSLRARTSAWGHRLCLRVLTYIEQLVLWIVDLEVRSRHSARARKARWAEDRKPTTNVWP